MSIVPMWAPVTLYPFQTTLLFSVLISFFITSRVVKENVIKATRVIVAIFLIKFFIFL